MRQHQTYWEEDKGGDGKGGGNGDGPTPEQQALEVRARRMGWAPKEEFRGDAANWKTAEQFVKDGEESLPILRERLRRSDAALAEAIESGKKFRDFHASVEQKAYDRAKKDIEARIKAAGTAGDGDAAAEAAGELSALERDHAVAQVATKADPEFDAFVAENPWYTTDPELKVAAEVEAFRLRRVGERSEGIPFLEKVKEGVMKQHPSKFNNARRQDSAAVDGSTTNPLGPKRGAKTWDSMPAEAKAAGEDFIKRGFIKDKATYAAEYWSQFEPA